MGRPKKIDTLIGKNEEELIEILQKKYYLGFGPSLAIVLDLSEGHLEKIKPYQCCEVYSQLPGEEKDLFFKKLVHLHKDFEFWKQCRSSASQLGNGSLSLMCSNQMIEFTADLKQLSEIYNSARDEAIKGTALIKMKKLVKEQLKKV